MVVEMNGIILKKNIFFQIIRENHISMRWKNVRKRESNICEKDNYGSKMVETIVMVPSKSPTDRHRW